MVKSSTFFRRAAAATIGAALIAGSAGAVTSQGTLGVTSTGTVQITASVANRAQITGLTDVTFSGVDPGTAQTQAQSNCVWSNTSTKGYSITATGSGTANAFTLLNGTSNTVPYTVSWAQTSGQSTGSALTSGTALGSQTTAAVNPTCSTSPTTTSSLIVGISAPNLQTMIAGASYTGTLTLVVSPQ